MVLELSSCGAGTYTNILLKPVVIPLLLFCRILYKNIQVGKFYFFSDELITEIITKVESEVSKLLFGQEI